MVVTKRMFTIICRFNMMKYYEFASDQYASVGIFHHFEGLLFNKVPLIEKIKMERGCYCKSTLGKRKREKQNEP
jgi:hypothetical protein